jgi:hypothetical protein
VLVSTVDTVSSLLDDLFGNGNGSGNGTGEDDTGGPPRLCLGVGP